MRKTKLEYEISDVLKQIGKNIRLARMRRRYTSTELSKLANISRPTLWHIEIGKRGVALSTYYRVLEVLGLEDEIKTLAADDLIGREQEAARIEEQLRQMKLEVKKMG